MPDWMAVFVGGTVFFAGVVAAVASESITNNQMVTVLAFANAMVIWQNAFYQGGSS